MKRIHGVVVAFGTLAVTFFFMAAWSLWYMAGLYDRMHALQKTRENCTCSRNDFREPREPTPEEVEEYSRNHNGSAPPASWYPNGDPWRNLTA